MTVSGGDAGGEREAAADDEPVLDDIVTNDANRGATAVGSWDLLISVLGVGLAVGLVGARGLVLGLDDAAHGARVHDLVVGGHEARQGERHTKEASILVEAIEEAHGVGVGRVGRRDRGRYVHDIDRRGRALGTVAAAAAAASAQGRSGGGGDGGSRARTRDGWRGARGPWRLAFTAREGHELLALVGAGILLARRVQLVFTLAELWCDDLLVLGGSVRGCVVG